MFGRADGGALVGLKSGDEASVEEAGGGTKTAPTARSITWVRWSMDSLFWNKIIDNALQI